MHPRRLKGVEKVSNLSKREQILVVLLIVLALGLFATIYGKYFSPKPEIAFKVEDTPAVSVMLPVEDDEEEIVVYVTGAVKIPGVYTLREGARVKDAIDMAGGHLPEADLLRLNLAQRLCDEDKLYVLRTGEGLASEDIGSLEAIGATVGMVSPGDGKVNINIADKSTLETLPGIGAVTSQKIIDYREKNGPFKSVEDIKNISGIGEKKFEQLRDRIKVK